MRVKGRANIDNWNAEKAPGSTNEVKEVRTRRGPVTKYISPSDSSSEEERYDRKRDVKAESKYKEKEAVDTTSD